MVHEALSRKIIGVAMEVLNELKPGLDEKLYERALMIGLREAGHVVEVQKSFPVLYHQALIGTLTPDLIVDSAVIVDTKVASSFTDAHISQMVGYLAITGLELALLLNFKSGRLDWRRVVRQDADRREIPDLHASPSASSA